ncbi:MAG: nitroreductase family protein [Candidatus Marinimicrobia bacterium]|nr:nitroreductase family protein [Candidatus Neomarinimicrobiota bacterium]MCF7839441.1 nitroreductase family protein [Candidatus Neomarinimicrobiota bacterium]
MITADDLKPADPKVKKAQTGVPILDALANRWSTRGFDPERQIPEEKLMAVAEAARWAPSANNNQPWRYVFIDRHAETRPVAEQALKRGNFWAKRADCLIIALYRESFEKDGKPNELAGLELGLSLSNLMNQATAEGLAIHPMAGFEEDVLREGLNIPAGYRIPVMLALGHYHSAGDLKDWQIESEYKARERRPLSAMANFRGDFSEDF